MVKANGNKIANLPAAPPYLPNRQVPARQGKAGRRRKKGGIFLFISILIGIYLIISFITDNMGFVRIIEMNHIKKALIKEITILEEDNKRLTGEIRGIKEDPEYIETLARDRLNLIKKGETVYRFAE